MKNFNTSITILILFIIIGAFLRFYNLDWGAPFYFHPDERNIASSVSQFVFPNQMHPHFFAYGSLPLYVFFFTGLLVNFFSVCHMSFTACSVPFEQAILISRMYSAVFSVLLIPLIYLVGKDLFGKRAGILTAGIATFSVGFIQFAHFGTTEMWLTYFGTIFFYLVLRTLTNVSKTLIVGLALIAGILLSAKISTALLLVLPLPALFFSYQKKNHSSVAAFLKAIPYFVLFLFITAFVFLLTNPYAFIDFPAFADSMRYESSVATGSLPVFYTQEFTKTVPVLFQFHSIYPFLLNPFLTIAFIPALFIFIVHVGRKRKASEVLLFIFFLTLFLSQAVLFVKWTRYMVPTLPFVYLILTGTGVLLAKQFPTLKTRAMTYFASSTIIICCSIFAFSFLLTSFGATDTRVAAASYAARHLPPKEHYLSEVYDLGITPFNTVFPNITLFNFYELENNNPEATPEALTQLITDTNYIILPSQRLVKTRLTQPDRFPDGYVFYDRLSEEKGYRKIYETPCTLLCRITYLGNPIFSYEETANVFDRPTVRIYQKI